MLRLFRLSLGALGLVLAFGAFERPARAEPKAKPKPAKVVKAAPKPKKAVKAEKPEPDAADAKKEEPANTDAAARPAAEAEGKLHAAGTSQADAGPAKGNVKEKEGPEGVKTYQFGAIEVEGRQKSPQLIYFLRRVRAEFDARALGHRSFLGELKDTRNDMAFR
jgi:hypothetical protein